LLALSAGHAKYAQATTTTTTSAVPPSGGSSCLHRLTNTNTQTHTQAHSKESQGNNFSYITSNVAVASLPVVFFEVSSGTLSFELGFMRPMLFLRIFKGNIMDAGRQTSLHSLIVHLAGLQDNKR